MHTGNQRHCPSLHHRLLHSTRIIHAPYHFTVWILKARINCHLRLGSISNSMPQPVSIFKSRGMEWLADREWDKILLKLSQWKSTNLIYAFASLLPFFAAPVSGEEQDDNDDDVEGSWFSFRFRLEWNFTFFSLRCVFHSSSHSRGAVNRWAGRRDNKRNEKFSFFSCLASPFFLFLLFEAEKLLKWRQSQSSISSSLGWASRIIYIKASIMGGSGELGSEEATWIINIRTNSDICYECNEMSSHTSLLRRRDRTESHLKFAFHVSPGGAARRWI